MNRRNFFTWIAAAIGWLWAKPKATEACASAAAWAIATPEGTLVPKVTPRCKVLVNGVVVQDACFADLKTGRVSRCRHDQFDPAIHDDIPRTSEYGFIDVELLGVPADAPGFTKVWLGANNYATVDEWKALNANRS